MKPLLILAFLALTAAPANAQQTCRQVDRERVCTTSAPNWETTTWSDSRGRVQRFVIRAPDTRRDAAGWLAWVGSNMMIFAPNSTREQRAALMNNLMASMQGQGSGPFRMGPFNWSGTWGTDSNMVIGGERVR